MQDPNKKLAYATWSGGIDSTAVIGQLLKHGWWVQPIVLLFGNTGYQAREFVARDRLFEYFRKEYGDMIRNPIQESGKFLSAFEIDGEIPRRNKHILDYMMVRHVIPNEGYYVAMGEYIGADTWLVKDHVGAHDADSRYLASYLLHEYGFNYRFMALNDFAESRYKADRVFQLVTSVGPEHALQTSNCMGQNPIMHCGRCYKCIERHVAFEEVLGCGFDTTQYENDPKDHVTYHYYLRQMAGELVDLSWDDVQ